MNTQALQHVLERKLSTLASACVNEGVEDHGLICEILSHEYLSDESRLSYISQIDGRLPQGHRSRTAMEIGYQPSAQDADRCEKQKRWNELHRIAVELNSQQGTRRQIPLERFLQLVSVLNPDNYDLVCSQETGPRIR